MEDRGRAVARAAFVGTTVEGQLAVDELDRGADQVGDQQEAAHLAADLVAQVGLATPAMHAFTLPIVHRDVDVTCATLGPSAVS